MADQYKLFYCLEQSIRNFVSARLEQAYGTDWWSHVPEDAQKEALKNKQDDEESPGGRRSDHMIDFVTFGQLGDMVRKNWPAFSTAICNQKRFNRVMSSLNSLRNPIAHCRLLSGDEPKRLEIAAGDWFRLLVERPAGA